MKFTRRAAQALRRGRQARGLTQYQLAEELGWPRSKIKRLEKHEVRTVDPDDLAALVRAVGIEPAQRKTVRDPATTDGALLVEVRAELPSDVPNTRCLDVVFLEDTSIDALRGAPFVHRGDTYHVHGIEYRGGSGPSFKRHDRAVLLLWRAPRSPGRPGAARPPGKGPKPFKADKGKPKPRLDYEAGTAKVLAALRQLPESRTWGVGRGDLERSTGYTACQVRAFAKKLEARGLVRREGEGRGLHYILAE